MKNGYQKAYSLFKRLKSMIRFILCFMVRAYLGIFCHMCKDTDEAYVLGRYAEWFEVV